MTQQRIVSGVSEGNKHGFNSIVLRIHLVLFCMKILTETRTIAKRS